MKIRIYVSRHQPIRGDCRENNTFVCCHAGWRSLYDKPLTAVLLSLLLHFALFFSVTYFLPTPVPSAAAMSVQFISVSVIPTPPPPQSTALTQAVTAALPNTAVATSARPTPDSSPPAPMPKLAKPAVAKTLPLTQSPTQSPTQRSTTPVVTPQTFTEHPQFRANSAQAKAEPIKEQTTAEVSPHSKPTEPLVLAVELAVNCPHRPAPVYSASARRLRESGTVLVKVWLSAKGEVEDAQIVESSGYVRLDKAALATVNRWRCNAPSRNGQPAPAVALQPFHFDLNR
ncbi:hypothetical protein A5320_03820 [Rheinheimera sp. SA_1]|uniref:energy transducer TonB n=1 Tax=Rheinheimera sp. SA_1 TaxID=1827365 RepID=UPI0007FFA5EB|nr:energy transducer TonB [Rheinheimera sp. SA_1]OBP16534.1 hypothetical protein A5320_03820 [Rheinheimera sp. SA_1]